jgi:hypothetical protein
MNELRSTAAFFRCSLNEALMFMTDMDVIGNVFEWWTDTSAARRGGWQIGEWKEGGCW